MSIWRRLHVLLVLVAAFAALGTLAGLLRGLFKLWRLLHG